MKNNTVNVIFVKQNRGLAPLFSAFYNLGIIPNWDSGKPKYISVTLTAKSASSLVWFWRKNDPLQPGT